MAAETCNGSDICLALRRAGDTYSAWIDTGLTVDTQDSGAVNHVRLTAADLGGNGHPQLALAFETTGRTDRPGELLVLRCQRHGGAGLYSNLGYKCRDAGV